MSRSAETEPQEGGKLKVLVVDDEPTLRLGFAYALSGRHTTVETAVNGRQALELLASHAYAAMVLDLRMPELDGVGVLRGMRERGLAVPVVLCSAALDAHSALAAIRHGVVDFLLKPIRPVDLRQAVEFVMRPDRSPFSRAMTALRQGRQADALALLDSEAGSDPRCGAWQAVVRGLCEDEEDEVVERRIHEKMRVLAFQTI